VSACVKISKKTIQDKIFNVILVLINLLIRKKSMKTKLHWSDTCIRL